MADRSRKRARGLLGLGTILAGAVAGAALEDTVYRRFANTPDPEADEPIGGVPGRTVWVEADDGTKLYTRVYGPRDARTASDDPEATIASSPLGGSGAAIVFAHGVVENHVIWHYLVRNLRADGRHKLVAYDARGHGHSGPARGPRGTTRFDGDTLGRDLAAVVERTTSGPVVLVGHSLGGMTALTQLVLDRRERERVAGGVIMNSTFTAELGGWRGNGNVLRRNAERIGDVVRRVAGDDAKRIDRMRMGASDLTILAARALFGRNASPRQVAVAFHMYETTPAQTLAAAVDLATFDVYDHLEKIDVPILLITGSRDWLTPPFLAREMARIIPSSELVVLDGCGHMAPFERHEEVTAHIRKFAERVLPDTPDVLPRGDYTTRPG